MMKKSLFILLCIYIATFCGCIESTELNEKAIVQAVGVDRYGDKYDVILQNFMPDGSGKIAFDPSKLNNIVVEEQGSTIGQAVKFIRVHHGKQIFFGNSNVIVIGRDTAEEGISDIFNYFNGNNEIRPNINIVMADGAAAEILTAQVENGPTPAVVLDKALEEYRAVGIIDATEMVNVVGRMQKEGAEAHMPIVRINMDAQNNPQYAIESTAIFKGDKLVGELNRSQTRGMRFFNDQIQKTHIVLESEEDSKFTVRIHQSKTKIHVDIRNDVPYITVDISAKGTIVESIFKDKYGNSIDDIGYVEELCAEKIESEVFSACEYTLKEKQSDAIGVCRYIFQRKPYYWKENKNNWDEIMPKVVFDINAKCNFDRVSLDLEM